MGNVIWIDLYISAGDSWEKTHAKEIEEARGCAAQSVASLRSFTVEAAVPIVCRSGAGRRQADGSRSDVVRL